MANRQAGAAALEFAAAGDSLLITLLGRPFPEAKLAWDRDAIDALVSVHAHPFSGEFHTTVFSHELVALRKILQELSGVVGSSIQRSFGLREATLILNFKLYRQGHICIQVEARKNTVDGARLQFQIETDQTFLPKWLQCIDESLSMFPPQVPSLD